MLILFSLGIQTVSEQNDQIIKELGNVKGDVENVKLEVENVKLQVEDFKNQVSADMSELGNVFKGKVENVKVEVENVKLQVEDFKNQVSADLSKLGKALNEVLEIIKTDDKDSDIKKDTSETARADPFSCFRGTNDSICLDGTSVGNNPVDRAMVTAKQHICKDYNVDICAGDTGIGYYKPDGKYSIIWKKAGKEYHINNPGVVYKCDGKH